MTKLDKDEVIAAFTAAYQTANGKAPQIEAKGGWYSVDGGKNVRLAALAEMTEELSGGKPAAVAAEPAAKAPAKKKATKKAAPAAAKSQAFNVVSQGEGMKPGDFWKQKLADNAADCPLPRGVN